MNHLTTKQAAERLGVSQRQVQRLIESGQLKGKAVSSRLTLVDPKSLAALEKAGPRVRGRKPKV